MIRSFLLALALLFAFGQVDGFQRSLADRCLYAHDRVRRAYHLPDLRWSATLANAAQRWATYLAERNEFRHDGDHSHGQNLFAATNTSVSPEFVVNDWASEARDYRLSTNSCSDICGHFTQIVWRDTQYVGCGVARRGNREVWACDYSPPGNVVGERPY